MTRRNRTLVGGVVAFEDGPRVAAALRSLLGQELPAGAHWSRIWAIVSPDHCRTLEFAQAVAAEDPRVEVVLETARRGKAAALQEIFGRAEGDLLVLLNGDAQAAPGSVAALVASADAAGEVYGVMARPVLPPTPPTRLADALGLLWGLHHRFHARIVEDGWAPHLSDELWALPIGHLPPLREGIIVDGAFAALWIRANGGTLQYARDAAVEIAIPARWSDHVEQRRKIYAGHWQLKRMFGKAPGTLGGLALPHLRTAIEMVRAELPAHRRPRRALAYLLAAEAAVVALAGIDRLRRRSDYAVWRRVVLAAPSALAEDPSGGIPG